MRRFVFSCMVCVVLSVFASPGFVEELYFKKGIHDVEDLVKILTPPAKVNTRGLVTSEEKAQPRSVSLAIHFKLNSYELTNEAMETLDYIGKSLNNDGLKKYYFLLEGHTDARGSEVLNLHLSSRRAEEVKKYLISKHHIDSNRLFTEGKGETELYDKNSPESGVNRRVRIINAGVIN
ncbi:MAG: OmpA family protein [Desulfamplus sp.]|nr:OmpA family protein [Desulfamplus sp.]